MSVAPLLHYSYDLATQSCNLGPWINEFDLGLIQWPWFYLVIGNGY